MDSDGIRLLILLLFFVLLRALYTIFEHTIIEVNDSRVKELAEEDKKYKRLSELIANPAKMITACSMHRIISALCIGITLLFFLVEVFQAHGAEIFLCGIGSVVAGSVLISVFADIIPRRFADTKVSEESALRSAPFMNALLIMMFPFSVVANFLPAQRADVDHVSSCVSVIDVKSFRKVKDIRLANGSNALHDMCISPDGRFVYVTHNLGRFMVPTSQLHQGWMNTSAFSVIDVKKQEFLGTVMVDEPERGAAGVWGIACDEDLIAVSHSGTHEVSLINHSEMLDRFLSCPDKSMLEYDLTFLYGIRKRVDLQGNGPRSICLSDGYLYIPTYFADILNVMDLETTELQTFNLNPDRYETDVNKGERYFNDASNCFQGWQSCNGCHPGDGRSDGMNWDLMNDGVGNPKNCKSMLFSHVTPPSMISGIRSSADLAVRAGFRFIQFFDISEEDARCVDAYLKSLEPVPSPYLVDGELSEKAKEGKKIYEDLKCDQCHSGVYYTDLKMYRIGEDVEFEQGWDTPTLREVWRTAPYLFDGRAATMEEVFEVHRHGIDRKVSKKEIEALTEYVNSL